MDCKWNGNQSFANQSHLPMKKLTLIIWENKNVPEPIVGEEKYIYFKCLFRRTVELTQEGD